MTLYKWDRTTPANNATADSTINWAEGQAPSSVNDSARGMMTATAKYRDDVAGRITTGGTSTAYTFTSFQVFDTLAHMDGAQVALVPHTNCGATVTLNVDGLGAKPLRTAPGVELAANNLIAGTVYLATYNNSSAVWYLNGVYNIAAANLSITTAMLADNAVTYAKIQQVTNTRVLGNFSGGTANVSEYAVAGGIGVSGSTLSFGLPAPSGFRNLSIKVATSTTVAIAADFVVMYDSTNVPRTAAISATCNLGTSGAVNALDTGSIAIDTWYYIYAISNGSTDGTLASTSSTAPTMPSGYTFKGRIGAVRTIHASAILFGTWQLGRRGQYIVNLANTVALPVVAQGPTGTFSNSAPTWVATTVQGSSGQTALVPSTASMIGIVPTHNYKGNAFADMQLAPSTAYGGPGNASGIAPLYTITGALNLNTTAPIWFMLETTTVAVVSGGTGGAFLCLGWEDNI